MTTYTKLCPLLLLAAAAIEMPVASEARAASTTVMIQRDDFDRNATKEDAFTADWSVEATPGATVTTGDPHAVLYLGTTPNEKGPGAAAVWGKIRFKASQKLVFTTRLLGAYVEQSSVYGDRQPRGLASGKDRNNAIEFVTGLPAMNSVTCRTVKAGVGTETTADIGHTVYQPTVYQIFTTADEAQFYIDGKRVCVHTTNIPTVGLNPYFSTSDSGFGNVPLLVDWVTFERIVTSP